MVCRTASWNTHTGFQSYQLKSRRNGFSGHTITNNGQLRSGKILPGPTNPGSCCVMLMAESGFGISNLSPWTHPAWWRRFTLVVVLYRRSICRNCVMPVHGQISLWNVSDFMPREFMPRRIQVLLEEKGGPTRYYICVPNKLDCECISL